MPKLTIKQLQEQIRLLNYQIEDATLKREYLQIQIFARRRSTTPAQVHHRMWKFAQKHPKWLQKCIKNKLSLLASNLVKE